MYEDDVILFGAAILENLDNMISILKKFGIASGLEINILKKSRLTFPKALHHHLRKILSNSIHILASTSFDKYLGVPLVTRTPKNADYEDILLSAGWQTKFVNFAGCTTLIKTVLSALPVCHIQTTLLPPKIIKNMEQNMRRFLWNTPSNGRFLAQIGWKTICLPIAKGDSEMNNSAQ